jgi:hypothetical protein
LQRNEIENDPTIIIIIIIAAHPPPSRDFGLWIPAGTAVGSVPIGALDTFLASDSTSSTVVWIDPSSR